MTKQGIIDKVRTIMNETGAETSFSLISEDTVKLSIYIESVIPDAVNILSALEEVDPSLLLTGNTTSSLESNTDGCTIVLLPADYLRFVSLRLSGWKREVQVVFPYGGDDYKIQHNPITRGGVNKPSCVYAYNSSGRCIECFPSGSLLYFHYVKSITSVNDNTLNNLSDRLFASICYMCAYLVYNIYEMPNTGKQMYDIALQNVPKL